MTDETADSNSTTEHEESIRSPLVILWTIVEKSWSALKTLYYANPVSWRFLKSGTLVFFGFFLWAGSNVLYSYNPNLTFLHYPMAYGFVLILYGPIHHLIVLPLAFRWRRGSGPKQRIGRQLPNTMLALFLVAVVGLATFPGGPMMVDFGSTLDSSGTDISPDLLCVKSPTENGTEIHCRLTDSEGIDRVTVRSGNTHLITDDTPPYEFTVTERELESVTGEKRFTVVLHGKDGTMIRRYTRRLSMIEEG